MDEKPDEIVQQIHARREQLGEHLSEVESKVANATDWQTQYRRHPYWFVGAAFGGGLLLSSILRGSSRNGGNGHSRSYVEPSPHSSRLRESMAPVKAALITFGAAKMKDMLVEVLPGFRDHLKAHQE